MEVLLQQIINGLVLGSMYALIALGYTMVYGIIQLINFAHGEVLMVGALTAWSAIGMMQSAMPGSPGWAILILAMLIACVVAATLNFVIEKVAYRPLRNSPRLAPLITAIGMSILLQNFVRVSQGARVKPLPPQIQGGITLFEGNTETGAIVVQLSYMQLIIIVTTVVLMVGFTLLINKTALGRAQRACEQDRKMAALLGVNVDRTISLTFVMGAALAAVAGLMFLLLYGVIDFYIGFLAGIKAFTAAVLGGIGSIPGAMVGGFILGLGETALVAMGYSTFSDAFTFVLLILMLLIKPTGLFGEKVTDKV